MILPAILSLALLAPQDPAPGALHVVAGNGSVSAATVAVVRTEAEGGLLALQQVFPGLPREPFRIVVDAGAEELPPALRATHLGDSPGFALLGQNEIHVLLREVRATGARLQAVLVHEMAHELIDQFCAPYGHRIPRWMHEGLAQVLARDTYLGASEEGIVWRAATNQLLPFGELEDGFPTEPSQLTLAYAQSHSYVAWLEREYGLRRLLRVLDAVDEETSLLLALVRETGRSTVELDDAWRDYLLHGSGAQWRALLGQCFSLSLIFALPLLALAMIRRQRADHRARRRLEATESPDADGFPGGWPPQEADEADQFADDDDDADLDDTDLDAADDTEDPPFGPRPAMPDRRDGTGR